MGKQSVILTIDTCSVKDDALVAFYYQLQLEHVLHMVSEEVPIGTVEAHVSAFVKHAHTEFILNRSDSRTIELVKKTDIDACVVEVTKRLTFFRNAIGYDVAKISYTSGNGLVSITYEDET